MVYSPLRSVVVDMLKDSKENKKRRMNVRGYGVVLFMFLEEIIKIEDAGSHRNR